MEKTERQQKESRLFWQTAKVFTKAPAFGPGMELYERRIITIRPGESEAMALTREGFDPTEARAEIINF